jgi:CHAT domain-containing protein
VVLAGCETAAPPDVRRNVDILALALVAAGATNAIGALWRVDDEATEALMTLLHRELRRGKSPAEALRRSQLSMRQSPVPEFRHMTSWAGFQVYGSGE